MAVRRSLRRAGGHRRPFLDAALALAILATSGCSVLMPVAAAGVDARRRRAERAAPQALLAEEGERSVTVKLTGRRTPLRGLYLGPVPAASDSFEVPEATGILLKTEWETREIPFERIEWIEEGRPFLGILVALGAGIAIDYFIITRLGPGHVDY